MKCVVETIEDNLKNVNSLLNSLSKELRKWIEKETLIQHLEINDIFKDSISIQLFKSLQKHLK